MHHPSGRGLEGALKIDTPADKASICLDLIKPSTILESPAIDNSSPDNNTVGIDNKLPANSRNLNTVILPLGPGSGSSDSNIKTIVQGRQVPLPSKIDIIINL